MLVQWWWCYRSYSILTEVFSIRGWSAGSSGDGMMYSMRAINCFDRRHHIAPRQRDILVIQICLVDDFWQLDSMSVGEECSCGGEGRQWYRGMFVGMRPTGVGTPWRFERTLSFEAFGVAGLTRIVIGEG